MKYPEIIRSTPEYQYYCEVKTPEEGLYRALREYADGRMTRDDLAVLGRKYCNAFPPYDYFFRGSLSEKLVHESLADVRSPEEFAQTELFKTIMSSPNVIERFKMGAPSPFKLTGTDSDYPQFWPQERREKPYSPKTFEDAPKQSQGWRDKLKSVLGLD